MKKVMSEREMIVRGCLPDEITAARKIFLSTYEDRESWISDGIKKGIYQAHTIEVEAMPRYVVVWHKNDQDIMHVNACAELNFGNEFSAFVEGMKAIAKKFGCVAIQGLTVRAGLVKKLCEYGFRPVGVTVLMKL